VNKVEAYYLPCNKQEMVSPEQADRQLGRNTWCLSRGPRQLLQLKARPVSEKRAEQREGKQFPCKRTDLIQGKKKKSSNKMLGMVAQTYRYLSLVTQEAEAGGCLKAWEFKANLANTGSPCLKEQKVITV
jgi:hypothetical protein